MDYMSNKALTIAVSLIVTMMIASAVLYTINQVNGVYKTVYETDTLIQSNFDEFDAFDGAVKTQLDLLNAAKKYKNNDSVQVTLISKGELVGSDENKFTIAKDHGVSVEGLENSLLLEKEEEKVSVDTGEASKKYNTYIERLDNGKVIIGFVS